MYTNTCIPVDDIWSSRFIPTFLILDEFQFVVLSVCPVAKLVISHRKDQTELPDWALLDSLRCSENQGREWKGPAISEYEAAHLSICFDWTIFSQFALPPGPLDFTVTYTLAVSLISAMKKTVDLHLQYVDIAGYFLNALRWVFLAICMGSQPRLWRPYNRIKRRADRQSGNTQTTPLILQIIVIVKFTTAR